jgi:hypothetical protein
MEKPTSYDLLRRPLGLPGFLHFGDAG